LIILSLFVVSINGQCNVLYDPDDDNLYYNLNPLASTVDYQCLNTRYPAYSFSINVCQPINYVDSSCVSGTGVCERSDFSSSKIGLVTANFVKTPDKSLQMDYLSGSGCFIARINFICREGAGYGNPVYVDENCMYSFTWETEFACPKYIRPPPTPPPTSPPSLGCQFTLGGKDYDFRGLDTTWHLSDFESFNYYLNPCSATNITAPSNCVGHQGCQVPNFHPLAGNSIGKSLTEIYPGTGDSSSILIFKITGGDYCSGFEMNRAAEITFGCGPGLGYPIFESENLCFYRFSWLTSLAC